MHLQDDVILLFLALSAALALRGMLHSGGGRGRRGGCTGCDRGEGKRCA